MSEQKKTLKVKLAPDSKAKRTFEETMRAFSQASNSISGIAYKNRCWNKVALHHLTYDDTRDQFGLPAQLACCARDKVAEAYAINERADILLLAGDVFDHVNPTNEVRDFFIRQMRKLKEAGIQAFAIAGDHDFPEACLRHF